MIDFSPKCLPKSRISVAPDGSEVRTLLSLKGESMAHFELGPGQTPGRRPIELWKKSGSF